MHVGIGNLAGVGKVSVVKMTASYEIMFVVAEIERPYCNSAVDSLGCRGCRHGVSVAVADIGAYG